MTEDTIRLMRLLEFTDSAFPVGAFAFSNGLESAAGEGLVYDAATLEAYVRDAVRQAAFTDGIVGLHAWRARTKEDYPAVLEADRQAILCKLNGELRRMTRRMGRKLAELAVRIHPDPVMERWLADVTAGRTPGSCPVAQGVLFAACGLSERALFSSQQYGAINMILSAALRCVRVSHYDTQRILFRSGGLVAALYDEAHDLSLDEMHAFSPQIDILAALHEKGNRRMFMN